MISFIELVAQTAPMPDPQTIITQLGVFAVVVVVFKFMLGRQDSRDAEQDIRDAETLEYLRDELASEKQSRADERESAATAMEREVSRHDATRELLYECQRSLARPPTKET